MLRKMLTEKIEANRFARETPSSSYLETVVLCLQSQINELRERIHELEKIRLSEPAREAPTLHKSCESIFSSEKQLGNIPLCESLDCVDDFHRLMEFELLEPE